MILERRIIGEAGVLDPDAQAVIDLVAASGRPPLHLLGTLEARKAMAVSRAALGAEPPPARTRDFVVRLGGGARAMRLYRPPDAPDDARLPLAVYFHGGGWMLGDLAYGDWFCASLVARLGLAVLAVDYRLAPEHRFPAAAQDATETLDWAFGAGDALGVRPDRMAVVGDSAGGNLAAVCAIHARDLGASLRSQVLIYPVIDLGMGSDSYRRNGQGYLLTAETMAWFRAEYLAGASDRDWRASPGRADLGGLAPALVVSGGFDVLADEAADYAERLAAAGVAVRLLHFAGQVHGFLMWAKAVGQSRLALDAIADELRARLLD